METLALKSAALALKSVVIRGIPKEGWKRESLGVLINIWWLPVVIRGIPKEGWKPTVRGRGRPGCGVVIRGIPKEGWKLPVLGQCRPRGSGGW